MARKAEPGISYYRMNCNHIQNRKIKLLYNEFGSDGYWVWQCILSTAYGTTGYYFDCNDRDSLELFALDVCKMRVAKVDEIIAGCLRRSLFDEGVFKVFGVLTSVMMQEDYLTATLERRKKTSVIELKEDYLLIEILPSEKNIVIIPGKNSIPPGSNSINPGCSTQSRVEYSREEKSRVESECVNESHAPLKNSLSDSKNLEKEETPPCSAAPPSTSNRIDEFEDECMNKSDTWQQHIAKVLQLESMSEVKFWIQKYFDEMRARDEYKINLGDTKRHCFSWVKIEIQKEIDQAKKDSRFNQEKPRRGVEAAMEWANVKMR